nr:hypothetical protein [Klebsiella pneumoniae]
MKSLLRIGDTYTTGDVFDSIQFRGDLEFAPPFGQALQFVVVLGAGA